MKNITFENGEHGTVSMILPKEILTWINPTYA